MKDLKPVFKSLWALLMGGGMLALGSWLVVPYLEETVLAVSMIVGVGLIVIGATKLANVF
ncbi:hypothetical protein LCGC14_1620910 [marine sediment metagenome]|uniref:Uncharacterized protein n=1 Tax=marine sediment metagenome TaxID=412755 RepID=A0A0F9L5E4_9ZZZZ